MSIEPTQLGISRALAELISTDRISCIDDAPVFPALDADDVADLKSILGGIAAVPATVDEKRAIALLAIVEPSPESAEILGRILANRRASTTVRVTAAANLAKMEAKAAEQALLASLEADDPFVRSEVLESLAKVGSEAALRRLQSLDDGELPAFARLLSGFRSGDEQAASRVGVGWRSRAVEVLDPQRVSAIIRRLWGSRFGIDLHHEIALGIDCGRSVRPLLLNRELQRGSWIDTLRARPLIAGLVALASGKQLYSVQHVVMTSPTETGIEIIVASTNRAVVYAGEATLVDDGLWVTVRDVGPARASIAIEGWMTPDSFHLTLSSWQGPRAQPRTRQRGHTCQSNSRD